MEPATRPGATGLLDQARALVQEVEDNLVELIRLSGGMETETEPGSTAVRESKKAEKILQGVGPQVPGVGGDSGAVSGQDEVDDLLSSLGF